MSRRARVAVERGEVGAVRSSEVAEISGDADSRARDARCAVRAVRHAEFRFPALRPAAQRPSAEGVTRPEGGIQTETEIDARGPARIPLPVGPCAQRQVAEAEALLTADARMQI